MSEPTAAAPSSSTAAAARPAQPHVGLFVTCLVDVYRPTVGFATLALLEKAGCRVSVPESQTCCGQPAWNTGDREDAQRVARPLIDAFLGFDYVVVPSGSCAGMIRYYPDVFQGDPVYGPKAEQLAAKTFEITSFLTDVMDWDGIEATYSDTVTYHDSCSGLRQLGIKAQPRALLSKVAGLDLVEMQRAEECCGFGGTFCVKYGEISDRMVTDKVTDIDTTGAGTLLAGEVGCLLNMAGKAKRLGQSVKCRHVTEVLAGMADRPAIGDER
ncbi:MAG: (Fe-S)-binding protein [Caenispirillum bisanense]|nr:(Fe-S)-binding protein [Caenispirillum bisanense]MCA1974399.1 (Fe-S)-binding protein [Caenispirillum sp.]